MVVWANGGCVRLDSPWHALLDRWAAAGFVVISISEPSPDHPPASSSSTAEDQAAAIDWAEAHPEDLDLDRVVAAGNSCGGITSLALAGQDDRVKAVFVLSGSSVGPGATPAQASEVMGLVHVPVGFAVGGPTDIARPQAEQDYDVLPDGVPGMVTVRDEGDHVFVSTNEGALADVAEIGLNWMDLALYGTPAALDAVNDPPARWTVTAKHLEALPLDG